MDLHNTNIMASQSHITELWGMLLIRHSSKYYTAAALSAPKPRDWETNDWYPYIRHQL